MALPYLKQATLGFSSPNSNRQSKMAVQNQDYAAYQKQLQQNNDQAVGQNMAKMNGPMANTYSSSGIVGSSVFTNLKQRSNSVGNPEYLGGLSGLMIGNQRLTMPNAIAQAISAENSYNQGSGINTMDKYFGFNAINQKTPYYSYSTLQDTFNRMFKQRPDLANEDTPLNKYQADLQKREEINMKINNLESQLRGGTTEKVNALGQSTGGNNQGLMRELEALKRSRDALGQQPSTRQNYENDISTNQYIGSKLRELEGYKPTVSNLAITETVK